METLQSFLEWAWARHHNVLSWYVRPLFLIPFCYFAYRRSGPGMATTVVALMTSMFWFPAPSNPSPAVIAALEAERAYLLGEWTWGKILLAMIVPLTFIALGAAFWQRSLLLGLVVVNGMVLTKIVWTSVFFDQAGFHAHLLPALTGLAIFDTLFIVWIRFRKKRFPKPANLARRD